MECVAERSIVSEDVFEQAGVSRDRVPDAVGVPVSVFDELALRVMLRVNDKVTLVLRLLPSEPLADNVRLSDNECELVLLPVNVSG